MVKVLLELGKTIVANSKVAVMELAGAGLVTYAAAQIYRPAGFAVAGIAVLAKSVEWDLKRETPQK